VDEIKNSGKKTSQCFRNQKANSSSISSPQEKNEGIFAIKINQLIEALVFKLQSDELNLIVFHQKELFCDFLTQL